MRKLFVMAALLLSVVGAMAQDDKPSVYCKQLCL